MPITLSYFLFKQPIHWSLKLHKLHKKFQDLDFLNKHKENKKIQNETRTCDLKETYFLCSSCCVSNHYNIDDYFFIFKHLTVHLFLWFWNPKTLPPIWMHLLIVILHQTFGGNRKMCHNTPWMIHMHVRS